MTSAEDPPSPAEVPAEPHLFPDYEDRGEVGRGGMAEVHRVFDPGLGREVAAKTVMESLPRRAELAGSLIHEAQITAQLEHPFIIPVHARGRNRNGTPFFTMKLVDGVTLSRWVQKAGGGSHALGCPQGARLAEILELFLKVCDAVAFAHEAGVLHRDIKPGNIMVGRFGQVYLMDWGVALRVDEQVGRAVMGTPTFMSPEQARGEKLDGRSDQFSLGAVLYFLLAGRPAYPKCPVGELLALVRAGTPIDLARVPLAPPPPTALLNIVRRAMHPIVTQRFPTVGDLSEAIRAFLRSGHHLPEHVFARGERVITEGEPGATAYVILEGQAEAYRVRDGERHVIRLLGPGEVFGELAVLLEGERVASVDALTELRVQVVSREVLESGLGMQSWVGVFVRALATRFAEREGR